MTRGRAPLLFCAFAASACVQIAGIHEGEPYGTGGSSGQSVGTGETTSTGAMMSTGSSGSTGGAGGNLPLPTRFTNFSVRTEVGTGDNVAKMEFFVGGSGMKKVVLRALGPSIGAGITDLLADPTLELRIKGQTAVLIANDNWLDDPNARELDALMLAPGNPSEAAFYTTLAPGSYEATMQGAGGTVGTGLIEFYDQDEADTFTGKVSYLSVRGEVLAADNVMIAGLIIGGRDPSLRLLATALGPSLAPEFTGVLPNPLLELAGGATDVNDDWGADALEAAAISATGHAPSDPLESAILKDLSPGAYTLVVHPAPSESGMAQVEAYDIP